MVLFTPLPVHSSRGREHYNAVWGGGERGRGGKSQLLVLPQLKRHSGGGGGVRGSIEMSSWEPPAAEEALRGRGGGGG